MLELALRAYLLAKTDLTSRVGQRITVGNKQFLESDDFPAITLEAHPSMSVAGAQESTLDGGVVDLVFPRFDFVVHALTWEESIAVGEILRRVCLGLQDGATIAFTADGDSQSVRIEQLTFPCNPYNDKEDYLGHNQTDKPRVLTVEIGWRQNVSAL